MDAHYHETLYRGEATLARLAEARIVVCGAGALGANVAEGLVRAGAGALTVVDRDRIDSRNLSTQPYRRGDVGSFKAKVLAGDLYRATGAPVRAEATELDSSNVRKLLRESELVIDAFDNSASRGLLRDHGRETGCSVLHAGMASDYAEVVWNDAYRVPSSAMDDVCDYPLARTLATLTASIACEVAIRWLATGVEESYTLTLGDLTIAPYPPRAPEGAR